MFDCGISEIIDDVVTSIEEENEKMIFKAVQSVGINVDKKQLEKALIDAKSFYNDGYEDAKKQYEPKWIPVGERLPEKTGLYLVSIGDLVTTGSFDGHNFRTQTMVRFIPDAWMPLPEEYKEREGN